MEQGGEEDWTGGRQGRDAIQRFTPADGGLSTCCSTSLQHAGDLEEGGWGAQTNLGEAGLGDIPRFAPADSSAHATAAPYGGTPHGGTVGLRNLDT